MIFMIFIIKQSTAFLNDYHFFNEFNPVERAVAFNKLDFCIKYLSFIKSKNNIAKYQHELNEIFTLSSIYGKIDFYSNNELFSQIKIHNNILYKCLKLAIKHNRECIVNFFVNSNDLINVWKVKTVYNETNLLATAILYSNESIVNTIMKYGQIHGNSEDYNIDNIISSGDTGLQTALLIPSIEYSKIKYLIKLHNPYYMAYDATLLHKKDQFIKTNNLNISHKLDCEGLTILERIEQSKCLKIFSTNQYEEITDILKNKY